jgi:hypothetical protein
MRTMKVLPFAALALLSFLAFAPAAAKAQPQVIHYHSALADLRTARYYMQRDTRPQFAKPEGKAIEELTKAIDEISKAVVNEGGKPWQEPPPEAGANPNTPLHSAVKLLNDAHDDLSRGEDIPANQGLQARALKHIEEALNHIRPLL